MEIRKKLTVFIFSILTTASLYSQERSANYKKGYILTKDKSYVFGEYTLYNGDVFLRERNKGKLIKESEIEAILTEEYFHRIQTSTPKQAAWDSILNFDSSTTYQFYNNTEDYKEDMYIRFAKISLLTLTAFLFYDTYKANQAVKDSYEGFNQGLVDRFQKRNQQYQLALGLTTSLFLYSTVKAYLRFGKDENWNDLHIQERQLKPIDDLGYNLNFHGSQQVRFQIQIEY
ncbi:MAG: hypothetical protein GW938_10015 [Leptospira sp.]|nr:hypothetical protein [Leptospira sp.]